MRWLVTPKWLLSHVFVLAMILAMTALGFWQLDRLDARKANNDEIRTAATAQALTIEELLAEDAPLDHRAVTLTGTYRSDLSFLVANRTFDTQPGSWLATPVELADGRLVVVGRGWVPRLWIAGPDPREVETPAGDVKISGRLLASIDGGRIGSGTDEFAEVSRMDLRIVEEAIGADLVDRWVQLEVQVPAQIDLPVPVPPPTLHDGPHLSYAFQWFFFSFGTIVAYALILRRRPGDARVNDIEVLALLAVRLRSRGVADAVVVTVNDLAQADVSLAARAAIEEALADGQLQRRGVEGRLSLTSTGGVELAARLDSDLDGRARAEMNTAYEAFLPMNRRFLAACASWQDNPADISEAAALVNELGPIVAALATVRPRFASYHSRMITALREAESDPRWLDSPSLDSLHTAWFELHEHMLATLGRQRTSDSFT